MSSTFTDITLHLQTWESAKTPGSYSFSFTLVPAPNRVWQEAFQLDWKRQFPLMTDVTFSGDILKLTLQTFLSELSLKSIGISANAANLSGKRHLAAEEEVARRKSAEEAAQEAEKTKLNTIFQGLQAKFNNP